MTQRDKKENQERLHRPVLLSEVIEYINVYSEGAYADLTYGEGGHSDEILMRGAKILVGNDQDKSTLDRYRLHGKFREDSRLVLVQGRFSSFLERSPVSKFDGILVDLGVSTRQLLESERGFSLMHSGPLDMRMDSTHGETLADLFSRLTAEELADGIYRNAELRDSRSLARRILSQYQAGRLQTTTDLANLVGPKRPGKSHPATALFTALRMMVNEERSEIETTLPLLINALNPGGRLVVISFHSTEDRIVKRLFMQAAGRCICDEKICGCSRDEKAKILTKKPLSASEQELAENPRARSAKLRCIEKL